MALMRVELSRGEGVRVFGPAEVAVEKGAASLLGAELSRGDRIPIPPLRSYYVRALEDSVVALKLGPGGRVESPGRGEEPFDEWVLIADRVIDGCEEACVVVLLGPTDSGKTSMAAVIANRALARGIQPAIIDADIGQADIGPPGFVSLAVPSEWVTWLRLLDPVAMRFVGSIEPGPVAGRIISSVVDLSLEARRLGAGVVVVDTDGWVSGWAALDYKLDMVRVLRASHVVVVGDYSLYTLVSRSFQGQTYYARSPSIIASRGPEERRRLRRENYKRFLDAPERVIDLSQAPVAGSCIALSPIEDEGLRQSVESVLGRRVARMSRYPGGICVAVEGDDQVDHQTLKSLQKKVGGEVIIVSMGTMRGVILAIVGEDGNEYPALLVDIDIKSLRARVKTHYKGEVRGVIFGRIRLGEEYTEAGRGRIWV